jgi:thiamine monophosphate kinase
MYLMNLFKSIPIKIAIKSDAVNSSDLIAIGVRPIGYKSIGLGPMNYSQLPIKTKGDQ